MWTCLVVHVACKTRCVGWQLITMAIEQCLDGGRDLAAAAVERMAVVPLRALLFGGIVRHFMSLMPGDVYLAHFSLPFSGIAKASTRLTRRLAPDQVSPALAFAAAFPYSRASNSFGRGLNGGFVV